MTSNERARLRRGGGDPPFPEAMPRDQYPRRSTIPVDLEGTVYEHGTYLGYNNGGCGCRPCKDAMNVRNRRYMRSDVETDPERRRHEIRAGFEESRAKRER